MKTSRSKRSLMAAGFLACALLVAGCDKIEALPGNYEHQIINNSDEQKTDVYNNLMSVIYDAVAKGKSEKVLDEFMYIIAQDQFGAYDDLKAVVEGLDGDVAGAHEKAKEFIDAHAKVYVHDDDEDVAGEFAASGATVDSIREGRLRYYYRQINDRINESFYGEINAGNYSDREIFDERRMAMERYSQLYDIDMKRDDFYKGYLVPEFKKHDVSSIIDFANYKDYIERGLIPGFYRSMLVEQYLLDQSYSTISRSYGRKVNLIKLRNPDDYQSAASNLMDAYTDKYVFKAGSAPDYDVLQNAWRGFGGLTKEGKLIPSTSTETTLETAAHYTEVKFTDIDTDKADALKETLGVGDDFSYYKETQLGIILDKYLKIDEGNRFASEESKSAESDFTSDRTYPKEVGLMLKIAALARESYLTEGWYVKNGGLSDLTDEDPDKVRSRLFNISVANEVDHLKDMETGKPTSNNDYDPKNYVRYINGHYYLTPAVSQQATVDPTNFTMSIGGTAYLLEVVEATSASKLAKTGEERYADLRKADGANFTEEVAFEIARILASKDTYVNSAYSSYIKDYSVAYHDSAIFDFFKEKYPELFEKKKGKGGE